MNFWLTMMRKMKGMMLRMPGMITCLEFESFVLAYFDDQLTPPQKRVFELHLKVCRECRDYLGAYRMTVALSKASFQDADAPLPGDVPEDLIRAILDARSR